MVRTSRLVIIAAVILAGAAYAGWTALKPPPLPPGIAVSNGRIEAQEIDVATKTAGRIAEINVREGDSVEKGQVLAQLDAAEFEAQLNGAKARYQAAIEARKQAEAVLTQRSSDQNLAQSELDRALYLQKQGYGTRQVLDQRQSQLDVAKGSLAVAAAQVAQSTADIAAAKAEVDRLAQQLDDLAIRAPHAGRVEYRLAEPGEVLAAGGRVVALIDLSNVYMTIFLPARDAARLAVGAEARLVLDAAPQYVIPATVSFVSPDAQFTPNAVETKDERDKLMFRVKLAIDPDLLLRHQAQVKSGVRGLGYVAVDRQAVWPANLAVRLP